MKFTICSLNQSNPSVIELTTQQTFRQIFPGDQVEIRDTFNSANERLKKHAFVIPGGPLYASLYALNMKSDEFTPTALEVITSAVLDDGSHYVGFCQGAFLGTEHMIAGKFDKSRITFKRESTTDLGPNLNFVPHIGSLGPILPYQNAQASLAGQFSTHAALINDGEKTFHTFYAEGPLFVKPDFSGAYEGAEVIATYDLRRPLEVTIDGKKIQLGQNPPAAICNTSKNSKQILISPHPELICQPSFLPAFRAKHPEIPPLCQNDEAHLTAPDCVDDNLAFLNKVLGCLKK